MHQCFAPRGVRGRGKIAHMMVTPEGVWLSGEEKVETCSLGLEFCLHCMSPGYGYSWRKSFNHGNWRGVTWCPLVV